MKTLLLLLPLSFTFLGFSQSTTKIDLAKEFLRVIESNKIEHTVETHRSIVYREIEKQRYSKAIESEKKELAEKAIESFRSDLQKLSGASPQYTWEIARGFTEEEINELIEFHSSALGKKFFKKGGFLECFEKGYFEGIDEVMAELDRKTVNIINK